MIFDVYRKTIPEVETITLGEIKTTNEITFRILTIRTKDSVYDLILEADTPENLDFSNPPDPEEWRKPKVYTADSRREKV